VNNGTGGQTFNYIANVTTTTAETSWANNQDTAQVFINSPPTAVNDTYTTDEDTVLVVPVDGVLGNDIDPDPDILTVIDNQSPTALGLNVTVNANGSFTYNITGLAIFQELASGEFLIDTFNYTITDGVATSTATVTINITGVNDDPTAQNDTATVGEDSGANAIDVLANDDDIDASDNLTVVSVTQPANGTVVITGGGTGLTYEPDANFYGTNTFTSTISDGNGGTDTATVNVTVINVNDPPLAMDDTASVNEDSSFNHVMVLSNDIDNDPGQPLEITAVTQPPNGSTLISNGSDHIMYLPDADFFGTDTFTYTLSDGSLTDTATVNVTVRNINDAPDIQPLTAPPGIEDQFYQVTLTATDIDGDDLTWSGVSDAFWVHVYSDGVVNGTPSSPGTYWALVTVNDGQGGTDDINLTITIDPDLDGDGITDAIDDDRDGDGAANDEDLWPDNPAESADSDNDGVGDNADPDDDNDGILDADDENPFTPDEPAADGGIPTYMWIAILLVAIGIGTALGYMFMGKSAAKAEKPEDHEEEIEPEDEVEPEDELVDEPVSEIDTGPDATEGLSESEVAGTEADAGPETPEGSTEPSEAETDVQPETDELLELD
jgi:VCBS repeat-containing protein